MTIITIVTVITITTIATIIIRLGGHDEMVHVVPSSSCI